MGLSYCKFFLTLTFILLHGLSCLTGYAFDLKAGKLIPKQPITLYPFDYNYTDSLKGTTLKLVDAVKYHGALRKQFPNENVQKYIDKEMTVLSIKKKKDTKGDIYFLTTLRMNDSKEKLQLRIHEDDFYCFFYSITDLSRVKKKWIGKKLWTNGTYTSFLKSDEKNINYMFTPFTVSDIAFSERDLPTTIQYVFIGTTAEGDTIKINCSPYKIGDPGIGIDFAFGLNLLEKEPNDIWNTSPQNIDDFLGFNLTLGMQDVMKAIQEKGLQPRDVAIMDSISKNEFKFGLFAVDSFKIAGIGTFNSNFYFYDSKFDFIHINIGSEFKGTEYNDLLRKLTTQFGEVTDHYTLNDPFSQKQTRMDVWAFYSPGQIRTKSILLQKINGHIRLIIHG